MKNNDQDILNKLKNHDNGFLIPENYFHEFENEFNADIYRLKSGYKSPKNYLDGIEENIIKKTINKGFKTPTNYFDEVDLVIFKKIKKQGGPKIFQLISKQKLRYLGYSIAASLLFIFSLNHSLKDENKLDIEGLKSSEIENWMDYDLISYNSYDIEDTFGDIELSNEGLYSNEELFEYLYQENLENLLIE